MSEKLKITKPEFACAFLIARGRLSDLPNIKFVIERYVEQLEEELTELQDFVDELQKKDLAEHG